VNTGRGFISHLRKSIGLSGSHRRLFAMRA
jgi:hypothetical protein